jgi:hypothetical protein
MIGKFGRASETGTSETHDGVGVHRDVAKETAGPPKEEATAVLA